MERPSFAQLPLYLLVGVVMGLAGPLYTRCKARHVLSHTETLKTGYTDLDNYHTHTTEQCNPTPSPLPRPPPPLPPI